jgi:hypothetical protein
VSDIRFNLVCCTQVITRDVADKAMKQKDVALLYAMALKSKSDGADNPDWGAINGAILARWSMSGLERIKKRAWDILAGKVKP